MAYLSLQKLGKVYSNGFEAIKGIDLQIGKGEFIVLLGPSGCGKTTTLRMIAGLEKITSGRIVLDDEVINDLAPKDRHISMIFQSYAVWPHMTVFENIAYPLRLHKASRQTIDETVRRVAAICEIEENLKRYPAQLSGGQRQRVAVARAIAIQSKLFLMDEPLSNLDAKLRVSVRTFLKQIHKEYNATTIFVTHDQSEALALADTIVVMNGGLIEQIGNTNEIYNDCDSLFVANFMGTPPANIEDVEIKSEDGKMYAASKEIKLPLDGFSPEALGASSQGVAFCAALRPESIQINAPEPFASVPIEVVEPQGSHTILAVKLNGKIWKLLIVDDRPFKVGERITMSIPPAKVMLFSKETGRRIRSTRFS
jgi:multiple sugar transport system ATP-binding protein